MTELKATRRVVTGAAADGRSVVASDSEVPVETLASPARRWMQLWPPAPDDIARPSIELLPGAVAWMMIEFPPGAGAQMHVSPTVDLLLVVSGEVTLLLETGETTLRAGDALVQRGTVHGWRNDSGASCLVSVVLVGVPSG